MLSSDGMEGIAVMAKRCAASALIEARAIGPTFHMKGKLQ